MNAIFTHIIHTAPEYTVILGGLVMYAVANMPTPETLRPLLPIWPFIFYKWLYDTLQGFMTSRNPHPANPTQPAEPAKPQGR